MKLKLCVLLLGVSLMVGCSATARFYPVQGPLSSQTPLPVPVAKVTFGVNPGKISVVLGDGGERHVATARALVAAGARKTIADRDGVTPLQHAQRRRYQAMVAILQ